MIYLVKKYISGQMTVNELLNHLQEIKKRLAESDKKEIEELMMDIQAESTRYNEGIVLYSLVKELLEENLYYQKQCQSLNVKELLKLATETISTTVPFVNDDVLNEMVLIAIENDSLEQVWRLAFNYNYQLKDKTKLEEYVISKKNGFYIKEFVCSDLIGIHIDRLVEALIELNEQEKIKFLLKNSDNLSKKNKERLKHWLEKIKE